jgi:hypothetical protein
MNTKRLAKHYDKLTPRERLPLILAAGIRGDDAEQARLSHSAPKVAYSVPDYFGLAHAFCDVGDLHLLELLDLAAQYFRAFWLAKGRADADGGGRLDRALFFGWKINILLAGWRQFCAEIGMDSEACWSFLPGADTLRSAERVAEKAAFTPEGVVDYLQRCGAKDVLLPVAGDVAADLRRCHDERAEWWG